VDKNVTGIIILIAGKHSHYVIFQMTLTDLSSKQTYTFIAKQWIKIDGEKDFWREFPVQTDDTEQQLPGKHCKVLIFNVLDNNFLWVDSLS